MDFTAPELIDFFKEDGILSRNMPRYEYRESQINMALAIENALKKAKNLIVEADTGVGKSLAYLIPSILMTIKSEGKIVISTNTINLQEQILYKDIPFLKTIIPHDFNVVLVKGRHNYICLRRFQRVLEDENSMLIGSENEEEIRYLHRWFEKTQDGTLADIERQPTPQLWDEICCELDNCIGKKCQFYNQCFFQKARAKVYNANILIVNHHLFFSDLALRQIGKSLLPEHDAVIFDEAHVIEDIATDHFGFEISNLGVRYLLNKLYNPKANKGILMYLQENEAIRIVLDLHKLTDVFFGQLKGMFKDEDGKSIRVTEPGEVQDILSPKFMELQKELKNIKEHLKNNDDALQEISTYIRRIEDMNEKINIFRKHSLSGHVYWIEKDEGKYKRIVMQAYPIVVGNSLRILLFDSIKTLIFTGATLSVNKSFEYFKKRIGIYSAEELQLGSSFNYQEQMKIYVPSSMPSPKNIDAYNASLVGMINKYIDYTKGKAFVLFTNTKLMKEIYERVLPGLINKGINSFIQGEGFSKHKMLEKFRKDVNSVLFGTDSFWTGVDVEGESLSNVIITRLPFAVPEHPLMRARIAYIEEEGGNAFMDYSLPQAIIKLRQGVGRLIRSNADKGIIVLLDNRILTSFYGKQFWDSLPECPRIID
jgi:ATP-dependent DNA helicase DinG